MLEHEFVDYDAVEAVKAALNPTGEVSYAFCRAIAAGMLNDSNGTHKAAAIVLAVHPADLGTFDENGHANLTVDNGGEDRNHTMMNLVIHAQDIPELITMLGRVGLQVGSFDAAMEAVHDASVGGYL